MKKLWILMTLFIFSFCIIGCANTPGGDINIGDLPSMGDDSFQEHTSKIYRLAQESGYTGTYEEWLETIKGAAGKSAYEVAVENGYNGSVQQWLEMLKGDNGKNIELSVQDNFIVWRLEGSNAWINLISISGLQGTSGREIELSTTTTHVVWRYVGDANWNNLLDLSVLIQNSEGITTGKSAYELAVELGFKGSIQEWLDSLRGAPGKTPEFSVVDSYFCWRYVGDTEWIKLFEINNIGSGTLQEIHTVTYVDPDGNELFKEEVLDGKKATKPEDIILSNGYEISEWTFNNELWSFIGYVVTEDIELVGVTRPHQFNIQYELNGGVIDEAYADTFTVEDVEVLPHPVLIKHKFIGWYLEDTFDTMVTNTSELPAKDVILYAKYEEIKTSCAEDPTAEHCKYNRTGFDGKGMQIIILSYDIDPFAVNYPGDRKLDRQKLVQEIEKEYNIDLVFRSYPDEAAWGPSRVNWIIENANNGTLTDKGHIFVISSDWVPTLSKAGAIAEVYDKDSETGIFKSLAISQNNVVNEAFSSKSKVYGYSNEEPHAEMFMYYNQSLVEEYGLKDPATLWNEGKWDWATFKEYLFSAQKLFDQSSTENKMYAFGSAIWDVSSEILGSRGLKFIDQETNRVLFDDANIHLLFEELRQLYSSGVWDPAAIAQDVPVSFTRGNLLFTSGYLWFLESEMRFKGQTNFDIGLVPYPAKTGYAVESDSIVDNYLVPVGDFSGYCFPNLDNNQNGLTTEVLVNICDDLFRGLKPEYDEAVYSKRDQYIYRLSKLINGPEETVDQIITAIMSIEDNMDNYAFCDLLPKVSMTVGNGSHFGNGGIAILSNDLIRGSETPEVILMSKYEKYQQTLNEIIRS